MKEPKLMVLVPGIARKFYLFDYRGQWGIQFLPPRENGVPGKRVTRATGQPSSRDPLIIKAAKQRASEIIRSFLIDAKAGAAAEKLKLRSNFATVGQILERYAPLENDVRARSKYLNLCSLVKILKDVFKLSRAEVEKLSSEVINQKTAEEFQRLRVRKAKERAGENKVVFIRGCISANSTMRQARSVISPKVARCYRDLKLPNFDGFRGVRFLTIPRENLKYHSPGATVFEMMDRDIYKPEVSPFMRLAYLLMRRLGLRNSEVFPARWNWIDRAANGQWVFRVRVRPDFQPKAGSRDIPIEPDFKRELDELRGDAMPNAWMINLPTPLEREQLLRFDLNRWMRRYIPRCDSEKCAYLLRKEAGSIIAHRDGIMAAAAFLGDTVGVTEKHYVCDKMPVRGISLNGSAPLTAGLKVAQ